LKADAEEGEYLIDRLTDEACSFISSHKGETPFFCYLSYYTVHTPHEPRVDLASNGYYAGMIAALDESVGRILACLSEEQLGTNTVVVLMSDNGGIFSNAPLRSKKGSTYEGGIREPMIVKWPGVSNDIGESQNLVAQMPEKAQELMNDLRTWRNEVGALMPAND